MLIILRNTGYTPKEIPQIRAQLASKIRGARFSNIRVSSTNIQFDLFVDCGEKPLEDCVARALGHREVAEIVDLSVDRYAQMDPSEIFVKAAELFNQERFWEFHEAIEAVWRREPSGPTKELLQGMILVAAALVHKQKNREEVGLKILGRAVEKLRCAKSVALPLDPKLFLERAEAMLGRGRLEPFKI